MNATPRKPREKNATPRKPHEKKKFEGGSNDAATNDDSGGAKKRWHGKHNRAKAKKAKGDEGLPPLSQQESVALKPGKPRPNAFLALRLSNPEIHSNVRRFQEKFLADNPKLGRFCVPVQKSHVSLQVLNMKVDDEAEVQKMLEAMKSAASVTDNNPISMSFAGTKRFGSGSVVYAAVTEGLDAVRALYASLQEAIVSAGFDPGVGKSEAREFSPHLTLLKTSRGKTREERKAKISEDQYEAVSDLRFGTQVTSCLQLCSMTSVNGYYKVLGEVPFSDVAADEAADHSQCCRNPVRPKPNVFLALRISDPEIHRNIREFHTSVTAADPRLHEICVPSARSHVTLDTLNIDEGAEESVFDALRKVAAAEQGDGELEHWDIGISGTEIAVDGRSVYAKVVEGRERLDRLREGIRKELTKRNLVNGGFARKPSDPHVTLLKSRHQREIDPMCYSDVADLDFGLQRCHSVQLLSMNGRGRPSDGGYFTKLGEIILGREDVSSSVMAELMMGGEESKENHKECCAPLKPEPNVFIALQITSPDIHKKAREFQESVVSQDASMRSARVPVEKSHISLHVFHLDPERRQDLEAMMRAVAEESTSGGEALSQFRLSGVRAFPGSRVLYANIAEGRENLQSLFEKLKDRIEEGNVAPWGLSQRPFTPHVTLFKMRPDRGPPIAEKLFEAASDLEFGTQEVRSLQLLERRSRDDDNNGYYLKIAEVELGSAADRVDGHEDEQSRLRLRLASVGVVGIAVAAVAAAAAFRYRMK